MSEVLLSHFFIMNIKLILIPISILVSTVIYIYIDSCVVKDSMNIHHLDDRESTLLILMKYYMRIDRFKDNVLKHIRKPKTLREAVPIPASMRRKYDISKTNFGYRSYWTVKPKSNISSKILFYIHGGAYIKNIILFEWYLAGELVERTHATIIIPDYEVAPFSTYNKTLPWIKSLYLKVLSENKPISFIGDSAGGGLSLSLCMTLRDENIKQPENIILLSPWLDVSMVNPKIVDVQKKDPLLDMRGGPKCGKAFAGNIDLQDWRVSPIYGDFNNLTNISIFIGTHDILLPDCRKFHQLLLNQNIEHRYYEFPNMFHVFMAVPVLKESKIANHEIATIVN